MTTNGPLAAALLHPALEDRRPERGDHLQPRQRRADARPARRDRRRLPRARAARRAARDDPDVPRRCRSSTRRSSRRRRAARAGTATTATATATAPATAGRGRRAGRAPATCGRCCRPSARAARSPPATPATAASLLAGMGDFASGVGLIPEQDWEMPDLPPRRTAPTRRVASIGFENGKAAGSASPLTWSAASFVRLAADLDAGRNVALPGGHERALRHAHAGRDDADASRARPTTPRVTGSPVTVTGTTAPGNTVYVSATNTDANSATTRRLGRGGADGSFSVDVPVTGGTTRAQRRRRQPERRDRRTCSARSSSTSCRARCCST